jgi:SAM-dependent methyltransferase
MGLFGGSQELVDQDWNKEFWGNNPAAIQFLEETGLLTRPIKILEIGSGKGFMLRYLTDEGHDVQGVDMDAAAIAECDSDLRIHQADATELPFEDNSFDIVLSLDLFEHVPDSDRHLTEVRRVLKNDGHYLLQTPNKWTNVPFESLRFFRKYGIRHTFDFLKPPEHCALHSYRQVRKRFRKHGFTTDFYDIPVVNDFFREKLRRFAGKPGLMALKVINPDKLPMYLRTNFYVAAQRLDLEGD